MKLICSKGNILNQFLYLFNEFSQWKIYFRIKNKKQKSDSATANRGITKILAVASPHGDFFFLSTKKFAVMIYHLLLFKQLFEFPWNWMSTMGLLVGILKSSATICHAKWASISHLPRHSISIDSDAKSILVNILSFCFVTVTKLWDP